MVVIRKYIFLFVVLATCLTPCSYANQNLLNRENLRTGFYLGSFPDVSLQDLDVALRFWSDEVSKQAGINSQIILYKTLAEMRDDFNTGKINFIVAAPLAIINNFDLEDLADGYKVVYLGLAEDQLLVVTHKDSGLDNFKSIKNKQLSLLLNEPVSDMFADVLALKNFGKKAKQVFKSINHIKKSNRLIYKIFFKKTDVIIVYKVAYNLAIELNPQIGLQTQVISTLNDIPRGLGFFHKRVDSKFRKFVIAEIIKLDTHPRGQQLLALFWADQAVESNITDLNTVQELRNTYLQLIDQYKNPK